MDKSGVGKVWLVGAGPGAPELITVRGAKVLSQAQVVIYDHLVSDELLNLAPSDAELIYAGKRGGGQLALTQQEINRLILEHARAGKRVVRLKGGDPLIFGRGGEEMLALAQAGVEFEVVPGVTSPIAAAAFAGIPVTHRDIGSFVAFVTGHEGEAKPSNAGVPWRELAAAASHGGTLVLLMATARMEQVMNNLVEFGLAASTPAAIVQSATTAAQKTVLATVGTLHRAATEAGIKAPTVIIVGQCVAMAERLSWFEERPLFGRRILVTRARDKAAVLADRLVELGAQVTSLPTIEIAEPDSYAALDDALSRLGEFDWVVFTSPVGVERFMARLSLLNRDVRELAKARIAAVGPATAERLKAYGLRTDVMPAEFHSEALAHAFAERDVRGQRFLLPRAQVAGQMLPKLLLERGAKSVVQVAAYKTQKPAARGVARIGEAIDAGELDLVVFTSPSTATNLIEMVGPKALALDAAAIGPVTAAACRKLGFNVVLEAREHTIPGLTRAIQDYFERLKGKSSSQS